MLKLRKWNGYFKNILTLFLVVVVFYLSCRLDVLKTILEVYYNILQLPEYKQVNIHNVVNQTRQTINELFLEFLNNNVLTISTDLIRSSAPAR